MKRTMSRKLKFCVSLPALAWLAVLQGCDPTSGPDPMQNYFADPPTLYTILNGLTGKETAVRIAFPSYTNQVNVTYPTGFTFLRQSAGVSQVSLSRRLRALPRGQGAFPPDPDEFQFDPWDIPEPDIPFPPDDPFDDIPLPPPPPDDPFDGLPDPPLDLPPLPGGDLPGSDYSPGTVNVTNTGGSATGKSAPGVTAGSLVPHAITTTATIPVGTNAAGIVDSPDKKTLYVAVGSGANIAVIDRTTYTIKSRINLPAGAQPYSLAITPDGSRLYTGEFVQATAATYSIDLPSGTVKQLPVAGSYMTQMIVTPDGTQLWICNFFGNIYIYDVLTNTYVTSVGITNPWAVAFNASGTRAYVTNGALGTQGSVAVIDTATLKTIATISVGIDPRSIRVSPSGRHIFVVHYNSAFISQIGTATNKVIRTIPISDSGASLLMLANN